MNLLEQRWCWRSFSDRSQAGPPTQTDRQKGRKLQDSDMESKLRHGGSRRSRERRRPNLASQTNVRNFIDCSAGVDAAAFLEDADVRQKGLCAGGARRPAAENRS